MDSISVDTYANIFCQGDVVEYSANSLSIMPAQLSGPEIKLSTTSDRLADDTSKSSLLIDINLPKTGLSRFNPDGRGIIRVEMPFQYYTNRESTGQGSPMYWPQATNQCTSDCFNTVSSMLQQGNNKSFLEIEFNSMLDKCKTKGEPV